MMQASNKEKKPLSVRLERELTGSEIEMPLPHKMTPRQFAYAQDNIDNFIEHVLLPQFRGWELVSYGLIEQ